MYNISISFSCSSANNWQDSSADIDGKLHLDSQQDCKNFAWKRRGNVTKFTFSRKFDTCDKHDYIIEASKSYYSFWKFAKFKIKEFNVVCNIYT